MRALLRAPLVAAACVAATTALAALAHPYAGAAAGVAIALVALPLALASSDGPRRILWSALAASALLGALRSLVAPPELDLALDPRVLALREALAAPIRALIPEPESGIVLGIVLGERAAIARDLRDSFAATGTAHLLAISGFHMSLVAGSVALALRGRARPVVAALGTVASAAAYAVLVGAGASVVRAALMAAVASLGLAVGRRGAAANGLGAAVLVMLVAEPRALTEVSFQLSAGATAGLIAWQRPLVARLARLPAALAQPLATTVAASIPTMPIVAATFGRVSLISPLANLVAVPLLAPIMLFGAATAAVGTVSQAGSWPLAMAAYASASALRRVVEIGAAVPGAAASIPPGLPSGIAVAALLVVGWLALPRIAARVAVGMDGIAARMRRRSLPAIAAPAGRYWALLAAVLLCLAVVVGAAAAASALSRREGFRLRALDIGQGDAFLLESDGRYALIDGGPDPALLLRRLGEVLPPWQRRIDLVALTHEHADHGAGLLGVLGRYEVGLAIEPVGMNDVPLVRFWAEHLARAHVRRQAVTEGAVIRLGAIALRVLAPGRDRRVDVPSLVIRADGASGSALFMGDAVDDAIADLVLAPGDLAARVYVPPHHGAETPHASTLVAAVRAEAAVISVGANNKYGHPAPTTLAALGDLPVYRTDRYGTVEIELDGHPLVVRTAKSPVPLDRGGPVPLAPASR